MFMFDFFFFFFLIFFFFFNDTATTEIYTLSLHDALPICSDMDLTRSDYKVALDDGRLLKTIFQKLLHNASWDPLYYSYSFADIEN